MKRRIMNIYIIREDNEKNKINKTEYEIKRAVIVTLHEMNMIDGHLFEQSLRILDDNR